MRLLLYVCCVKVVIVSCVTILVLRDTLHAVIVSVSTTNLVVTLVLVAGGSVILLVAQPRTLNPISLTYVDPFTVTVVFKLLVTVVAFTRSVDVAVAISNSVTVVVPFEVEHVGLGTLCDSNDLNLLAFRN